MDAAGRRVRWPRMPIALKDNIVTVEQPTTCASRILEGYVSPYNATAVERLRAAGAMIAAKSEHGRVRHGLVHRALRVRAGEASAGSRRACPADPRAARRRWWRRA